MPEGVKELVSDETLTPREREVLQLIADGKSTEETAHVIGMHYKTVMRYVRVILVKLNSPTTDNAVATAIRRDIID